ncbi:MAG TPA: hypothetical protein VNJ05_09150 [Sphingomicrobium sp.]|nr:hypothetical protein [Sphingomicrobium sp.]
MCHDIWGGRSLASEEAFRIQARAKQKLAYKFDRMTPEEIQEIARLISHWANEAVRLQLRLQGLDIEPMRLPQKL